MKVILIAKVEGLGDVDDIKEVADGHAVNYLFPRHLAVLASPKAKKELEDQKRRRGKEAELDLREQQSVASRLDGIHLELKVKTNEAGLLYAAIGPQKIAEELQKIGFTVAKNQIDLKPIKEPGEYEARVKLRHRLEAKISVIVSPQESSKKKSEE